MNRNNNILNIHTNIEIKYVIESFENGSNSFDAFLISDSELR